MELKKYARNQDSHEIGQETRNNIAGNIQCTK